MGIPLPASTQWLVVERAAKQLAPAHRGLLDEAAQGEILHNDDTSMKILELKEEAHREILGEAGDKADERTGVFTSGIVATRQIHRMALFFTGPKHAGENLGDVLRRRAAELSAPIQMCDALDRNLPGEFQPVLANCLAHGRRHYVDVVNDFPEECRFLLETVGEVYKNDDMDRQRGLSPDDRLRFHQEQSGPFMEKLERWLREQVEEHKVEPNSGLSAGPPAFFFAAFPLSPLPEWYAQRRRRLTSCQFRAHFILTNGRRSRHILASRWLAAIMRA